MYPYSMDLEKNFALTCDHSVVELQRWLQCRVLKLSGNKPDLMDRCKACLEVEGKNGIVVSIDESKWFQKKVQEVLANVQNTDNSFCSASDRLERLSFYKFPRGILLC
ncbi:uncharacterized protein LOC132745536 [Ruditapes philippinarum]|uniref:uncharacterized protein LOC132745536 n=1 Tax=Ruditapes philippinarum TaxID=129788 RepID=UPI00295C2CC6|nr:uncharacterized protein LOC132745536 [Ruditapes philippinarum]